MRHMRARYAVRTMRNGQRSHAHPFVRVLANLVWVLNRVLMYALQVAIIAAMMGLILAGVGLILRGVLWLLALVAS